MTLFDPNVRDLMAEKGRQSNTTLLKRVTSATRLYCVYRKKKKIPKNKDSRTLSINAQYMVLFKNPRDSTRVVNLAK